MKFMLIIATLIFSSLATTPVFSKDTLSDKEVIDILIKKSIRAYSGNCPCPFNVDRAGRRCGKRSAWSKPGGATPLCYESDVSKQMIKNYRKIHGLDSGDS
ncbi:hypothetical protein [Pleionea mediterranea]|uniref:Uncharacterized protein n=1 Tax=Pleionea mediterranea TaxID=523701 RepID=A0A316FWR6_9GAMM|nr:hypothetical protein [Pleionea mediterranea]PWK52833.1 hypothetical protein C8D97_10451 [Pleionea mediterranea]